MSYIGTPPSNAFTSLLKQDFTTSVTTGYTLDHAVNNANDIALFINFVRQEPTAGYAASGTTLTLTSATASSDDMYCVYLGQALQTVNPPNGSVGASQIADGSIALGKLSATGTKDATTFLRGDNTFASAGSPSIVDNGDATAITIDSSENVGIGISPTPPTAYGGLHIHSTYPVMKLSSTATGSGTGDGFVARIDSTPRVELWNFENSDMVFATNDTERMRIFSTGQVGIGETSLGNNTLYVKGNTGSPLVTFYDQRSTSTFDVFAINSDHAGTETRHFLIEADGDVFNTFNSYGSLSDRKFKENETDANSQWNDIKKLKIKNYNLKISPDKQLLGVIAQDLEASGMNGLVKDKPDVLYTENDVLPEGKNIGDIKEESYKEVKYSVLYMKSVKALQEAMERIETLEAKVTALENA